MEFHRHRIREEILIPQFITFYYFELSKGYISIGEKHDFWEMVYVDKGETIVNTDRHTYFLQQGDIVFYKPNEFHIGRSGLSQAPNLFVVTFECRSPKMDFFRDRPTFRAGNFERSLLETIIKEGVDAFGTRSLTGHGQFEGPGRQTAFGSEQLCRNYLEALLIHLIREAEAATARKKKLTSAGTEMTEVRLTDEIIAYMEANLGRKLSVGQLCDRFGISRSRLGLLFKEQLNCGAMEHFNQLKIQQAKAHIRNDNYNISEISERLGYSSIHYFSRHFKNATGMTPLEYSKTVKSRFER